MTRSDWIGVAFVLFMVSLPFTLTGMVTLFMRWMEWLGWMEWDHSQP